MVDWSIVISICVVGCTVVLWLRLYVAGSKASVSVHVENVALGQQKAKNKAKNKVKREDAADDVAGGGAKTTKELKPVRGSSKEAVAERGNSKEIKGGKPTSRDAAEAGSTKAAVRASMSKDAIAERGNLKTGTPPSKDVVEARRSKAAKAEARRPKETKAEKVRSKLANATSGSSMDDASERWSSKEVKPDVKTRGEVNGRKSDTRKSQPMHVDPSAPMSAVTVTRSPSHNSFPSSPTPASAASQRVSVKNTFVHVTSDSEDEPHAHTMPTGHFHAIVDHFDALPDAFQPASSSDCPVYVPPESFVSSRNLNSSINAPWVHSYAGYGAYDGGDSVWQHHSWPHPGYAGTTEFESNAWQLNSSPWATSAPSPGPSISLEALLPHDTQSTPQEEHRQPERHMNPLSQPMRVPINRSFYQRHDQSSEWWASPKAAVNGDVFQPIEVPCDKPLSSRRSNSPIFIPID